MKVSKGSPKPPRVVLYGPPGVGKSTFGADSRAPIFLPTEDGVDNVPVPQAERAREWVELLANARECAAGKGEYKTVVIDTLNGAAELCSRHVCQTLYGGQWTVAKGNGGFLAWGQGWKATAEEFMQLLAALDDCRAKGMTVLLLSHVGLLTVKTPSDGEYTKYAPDVDKNVWARVCAWSDIVLRAEYEHTVIPASGPGKGKVASTKARRMFSAGSAAEDAKCRVGYELPEEMPLSWAEFAAALGKGAGTVEAIKALMPLLTSEEQAKAMAWMGGSIEGASLTKQRQLLGKLDKKAAEIAATKGDGK